MASLLAQAVGGSRRVTARNWQDGELPFEAQGKNSPLQRATMLGALLRRSGAVRGDEGPEFRVVLQDFQVGIADGPFRIGVAGFDATPEHLQRVCLHRKRAVSARGVVEHIGIGGTHGHGNAHVQHRIFGLAEVRQVRCQQDARADIVGKLL